MSRKSKIIAVVLMIVFCVSLCTISVWAVENASDYIDYTNDTATFEPVDPSVEDTTAPSYEEPEVTDPIYTEDTYPGDIGELDPTKDTTSYEETTDTYEDTSDYSDVTEDTTYYQSSTFSEYSYVGGGQTYTVPETTAPPAALYDVKEEVDGKELNSNDWKDIAQRLKDAGSADDDDGDDFGFIKNNNSTTDNGEWLLIGGILCLVLSAAGIAYIVVSTVKRKKSLAGHTASANGRFATATATASAGGRYRKDEYGDGFKASSSKKSNKSNKFDTADVRLPKSSQSRYKNSDKRYK